MSRPNLHFLRRAIRGWVVGAVSLASLGGLSGCKGDAPTLLNIEDQVAVVGQTLVIQLIATDPEGDSLDYDFRHNAPDLGDSANLSLRPDGSALFTWTPDASHLSASGDAWTFEFSASDGKGKDAVPVAIAVRGAVGEGSEPIFRQPISSGFVLQLDQQDCVEFDVLIDDQDSADIKLEQDAPLAPGATLNVAPNGLSGSWEWCPRKDQAEAFARYDLTLTADDGENPVVKNDLIIAVRGRIGSNPDCPGEAPTIEHEPTDFNTVRDLEIKAKVSDAEGLKNTPLLFWTTEEPGEEIDLSKMTMVEMTRPPDIKTDEWTAKIKNPLLKDRSQGEINLYYVISATDDDDADGGSCDHTVDFPDRGTYRISVGVPADAGEDGAKEEGLGLCDTCSADIQCGGKEDRCVRPVDGGDPFCVEACDGDSCPDGFVCSPNEVVSVDDVSARQCIPVEGVCKDSGQQEVECQPDAPIENLTLEAARPLDAGDQTKLRMCPEGDKTRHWFQVDVLTPSRLSADMFGAQDAEFDMGLVNAEGQQVDLANDLGSEESVSACVQQGTYYLYIAGEVPTRGGEYLVAYNLTEDPACGDASNEDSVGGCCDGRQTPGCDDTGVQDCVCGQDPFCCDIAWDSTCVAEVDMLECGQCNADSGDCCEDNGSPGCNDEAIESCVCAEDEFCCDPDRAWDALCSLEVDLLGCGQCGGGPPDKGDCCEANDSPGCNDAAIEACVCAADDFCCDPEKRWDALCASKVTSLSCDPGAVCGPPVEPPKGDCCDPAGNGSPGCDDDAIESCVCAIDDWCCDNEWDSLCVSKAINDCSMCGGAAQICEETCAFADDGACDDGGPGSDFSVCDYGTDCMDCGARDPQ